MVCKAFPLGMNRMDGDKTLGETECGNGVVTS